MSETVKFEEPTREEEVIYEVLRNQCKRICDYGEVHHNTWESILAVCDIFCLTKHLAPICEPEDAVKHLRELIRKGFVKVFYNEHKMMCYVPSGWSQIKEVAIKHVDPPSWYAEEN